MNYCNNKYKEKSIPLLVLCWMWGEMLYLFDHTQYLCGGMRQQIKCYNGHCKPNYVGRLYICAIRCRLYIRITLTLTKHIFMVLMAWWIIRWWMMRSVNLELVGRDDHISWKFASYKLIFRSSVLPLFYFKYV